MDRILIAGLREMGVHGVLAEEQHRPQPFQVDLELIVDLAPVVYVDSATIGCLMDLYRQAVAAGGSLKLASVQKRVETMLTMTGAHNFIQIFENEAGAVSSFGG